MDANTLAGNILGHARSKAGMSQRRLALEAGTAQSVIARVELGEASPTLRTLEKLIRATGFELAIAIQPTPIIDPQMLDDVARIRSLSPENRLREVANLSRFQVAARHA